MRISLFWRTFGLMVTLVAISLAALFGVLRWFDRAPAEQRLAWEIASVANLTRSALVSSQPERRLMLLRELARDEGVRVLPLESGDRIESDLQSDRVRDLRDYLRNLLGTETLVVLGRINDIDGLWVSFDIDGDGYWLLMQRKRLERHFGPGVSVVLGIAAGLSMLGALIVSRLVNQPLSRLAGALGQLSRGESAPRLPEEMVVSEIAEVNRRFNEMARDLSALDADRSVALAGISHDIRSPLARLRMEVEMAPLDATQRASMVEDIERIDRIVGQFVEFARAGEPPRVESVDVAELLAQLPDVYRPNSADPKLTISIEADRPLRWHGDPVDLQRALGNLIDNAIRYGRHGSEPARIRVRATRSGNGIEIIVDDEGPGVPQASLRELLRPFSRLDKARGAQEGSGLGLAIVERLARRYEGRFSLENRAGGGLSAILRLPDRRRRVSRHSGADSSPSNPGAIVSGNAPDM